MHLNKPNQKSPFFHKHSNNKVVVIETLENDTTNNEATKNSYFSCRQKHKKGKSMDLTAQKSLVTDRNQIILDQKFKNTRKTSIPSCIVNEFRYKNNISQMKDYNISKKLESTRKKWAQLPISGKKKKVKVNFSGQFMQLTKELKAITIQPGTKRKTSTGKISDQTYKQKSNSKQTKINHKSVQLPLERKQKYINQKNDLFVSKLLKKGITMPLSSKLQSLYSNTTSLFSSRTDFSCSTHNYAISTEQSVNEIFEIRQFQSLALNDVNNSIGLKKLSNGSLIKQFIQNESEERQKTTQDLISNFVKMINFEGKSITMSNLSNEIQKSMDFLNISKDLANNTQQYPYNKQILEKPLNSQQIQQSLQNINNNIQQQPVLQQEIQIQRLNEIISIIKQKDVLSHQQKYRILQKMKQMLSESKGQQIPFQGRANIAPYALQKYPQLLKASEEGSNINLHILDKILRDREQHLIQCREKEINKIQIKQQQNQQQFEIQKQVIVKRFQYQIKEVVHTRLQLWKGLNFTDKLAIYIGGQQKQEKMMKCLSERYLRRNKSIIMEPQKQQISSDSHQNSQMSKKDKDVGKVIQCIKQSEILYDKVSQFLNKTPNQIEDQSQPIISQGNQVFHEQKDTQKPGESILRGISFLKHFLIDQDQEIVTPHQNQPLYQQTQRNVDTKMSKNQRIDQQIDQNYPFHNLGKSTVSIEQEDNPLIKSPFDNLTLQDKQDICQFVFIDLCIEVTEDYSRNSPLMHHIFNYIKKMKEQSKKPKGFKTNSNTIKEYLNQLISFIKCTNFSDSANTMLMEQIYRNLDVPIGPSALQILKFMHVSDQSLPPQDQTEENLNILNPLIFQQFQEIFINKYQFQKYYNDEEKQRKRISFLKNALHVHNKAIFDTLNERLDIQRPFGLWGKPFSWKKTAKFYHDRNYLSKNDLIYSSAQRAIQFGSYLCGFMVDKQDCSFRDNPNVTQSYIDQIRIDRLTRMLAEQVQLLQYELQEDQEKMLFIDDEQTEFQVQISEAIWQKLLLQFYNELP